MMFYFWFIINSKFNFIIHIPSNKMMQAISIHNSFYFLQVTKSPILYSSCTSKLQDHGIGHYIVTLVWGWNDNLFLDRLLQFAQRCFSLCEVLLSFTSQRLAHPHPEDYKKWALLLLTHKRNVFSFFLFCFVGLWHIFKRLTNLWKLSTLWTQRSPCWLVSSIRSKKRIKSTRPSPKTWESN